MKEEAIKMKDFFFNLFFERDIAWGFLTKYFIDAETFAEKHSVIWLYVIIFALAIGSYFLGSVNFSIVLSHKMYNEDIRDYGSKNPGATNMKRVYGQRRHF